MFYFHLFRNKVTGFLISGHVFKAGSIPMKRRAEISRTSSVLFTSWTFSVVPATCISRADLLNSMSITDV